MKIKRRPFATCLLLLASSFFVVFLPFVSADFELKRWAKWRDVILTGSTGDYALIKLDGQVFAGALDDLRDLRVVDGQGIETPSKLIVERGEARQQTLAATIIDQARAGDRSLFTLDLGVDPAPHNRVDLDIAAGNFARRVMVEASDDNRRWTMLRDDGYLVSFSGDATTTSFTTLDYALSSRRYLRLSVFNRGETPLAVNGATVSRLIKEEIARDSVAVAKTEQQPDAKQRASIITLDLGFRAMPSSSLNFETSAANFHRRVELAGSQDQKTWSPITSGYLFDISLDHAKTRQQLALDYDDARVRYLRATVFNQDDQPLKFDNMQVSAQPHRLLFRRAAGKSYRLFYGNVSALAPQYDLEQLSGYLALSQLPTAAWARRAPIPNSKSLTSVNPGLSSSRFGYGPRCWWPPPYWAL